MGWRWPAKNHADVGTQRGVQLFISSGPALGDNFSHVKSKSEWVNRYPNLQRTFSNCYLNGVKVGPSVDKALCYGTFEVPADLKEGIYTFMWRWEFNAGEFYNSCADVMVGPVGGSRPTPAPTPVPAQTPTPMPSPGGSCGDTWSQCGGNGWSGATCCTTGNTCRRNHEWYSQCVPGSPQTPVPTPVPAPMSTVSTTLTSLTVTSATSSVSEPEPEPEPACEFEARVKACVLHGGFFSCKSCVNETAGTPCCSCKGGEYSETTTTTATSTTQNAQEATTTTASDILPCKPWCASNEKGWEKKCKWTACSGCLECSTRRLRGNGNVLA